MKLAKNQMGISEVTVINSIFFENEIITLVDCPSDNPASESQSKTSMGRRALLDDGNAFSPLLP